MTQWTGEHDYDDVIQAASLEYGIAAPVIQGLIATESGFNADAYKAESGGRASIGLTQLLLGTAQGLGYSGGIDGLYDPATNVDLGVRYLAQQYARAGSWWGAYSAYNGGWNPAQAMGVPATADLLPLRVIVNSNPLTYRNVALGEYGNQPAVDRFAANVRYFQGQPPIPGAVSDPGPDASGGGGGGASVIAPLGVMLAVGAMVVAYALTRRH